MSLTIKAVTTKEEMKQFICFNYELYKDSEYAVPDLYNDVRDTLDPKKNAAFEFCEAQPFIALRDDKVVGRIVAIINNKANFAWNKKSVRFGWVDFIDDKEVVNKLFEAAEKWGRERGMNEIHGPLGFTDFDPEGMLVEGFDRISTIATIYNYPYYPVHMERMGFEKSADWVEMKIYIPDAIPEKHKRISDIIQRKYNLRVRKLTDKKDVIKSGVAHEIFRLINDAYAPLFGFSRMTEAQIDQYVNVYIPVLDLRMVTLVETEEGEIVAVGISMPSLSEALQKAKGKFFPFGWYHLLKALKWNRPKVLDLLLVAVRPDYQSKGVNALLFTDLIPVYQEMGFEYAESNPELEDNGRVQNQWQYFKTEQHKRRRCYTKAI